MHKNLIIGILSILLLIAVGFIAVDVAEAPERDDSDGEALSAETLQFKSGLEATVRAEKGQPIEGYEPSMFMEVFPGLEAQDFDDVDAAIGQYVFADGELRHELDASEPLHSAAAAITEQGMETLFQNVSARLGVTADADVVFELLQGPAESPEEVGDDPVACTMDAKQCPDGSYVGRVGPNCEFAACPGE